MAVTKGSGWTSMRLPDPEYLPTPSFGINRALGGKGLSSGRITLIWGLKASGKSTMVFQQIAHAQAQGKVCAYVDAEGAVDKEWAEKNGVDLDKVLYKRQVVAEDILLDALPLMKEDKLDILVVDSLSSIQFESYFDVKDPGKNSMGGYARSSKMFTHKILAHLKPHQHVIFISHAAMDLSGFHPQLKASVGNAIDHWASTVIKVSKVNAADKVREDGAFPVKWKIEKSKQSVYPVVGQYFFNPKTARIDHVDEVITYGLEAGLVKLAGAWYSYDDVKGQGKVGFAKALMNDLDVFDKLKAEINAIAVSESDDDDA